MLKLTIAECAIGTLAFGLATFWCFTQPMNPDEMEHLHSTFLLLRGLAPYEDFFQNHAPMVWLVLAPVMKILPESSSICYVARAWGLLNAILTYLVACRLALALRRDAGASPPEDGGQETARTCAVVGIGFWGLAIPAQIPIFRSDDFMIVFAMLSVLLAVGSANSGRAWFLVASGIAMGLSVSFSSKLLPVAGALPFATILAGGPSRHWIRTNLVYGMGVVVGLLPLAGYLFLRGIERGFFRWVVEYNRFGEGRLGFSFDSVWIPAVLILFSIVGLRGLARPSSWRRTNCVTLRVAFGTTLLCSIFLYPLHDDVFAYYLSPLVAFGSVLLGARLSLIAFRTRWQQTTTSLVAVAVWIVALFPSLSQIEENRTQRMELRENVEFIQWMIDASSGETVHCMMPDHPIYAFDMTPFYVFWQYHFARRGSDGRPARREMLLDLARDAGDFRSALLEAKPAVIGTEALRRHLEMLRSAEMIDDREVARIRELIDSEYRNVNGVLFVRTRR